MKIALLVSVSLIAATPVAAQPAPLYHSANGPSLPVVAMVAGASSAVVESPAAEAQPLDEKAQKEAARAAKKAARQAAAAERKRMAELRRLYGDGPYPDEIEAYLADKPEDLHPLYRALFTGGERNAVLNFERLGLAAMDAGHWSDAEAAFDGALARIEAIYANNDQAARARSLFHNEANKDFKGEPYERAMAYYYRGLLYLRAGDFDNARASFKAAEYQDTLSETETFQEDFAVMNYLTGWTYHCQGQPTSAAEAFEIARQNAPSLAAPGPDDKVLLIAELGRAPIKARDGAQAQKLVFQPAFGDGAYGASYTLGAGEARNLAEASSVHYQATTRGGRAIDGVLDGKASFKETTSTLGDVASSMSLASSLSGDAGLGLGFAAAGALFSMFSSAAKTQADIRAWDNLSDKIMLSTAALPGDGLTPTVQYMGGSAAPAAPVMAASTERCSVVWSRSQGSGGLSPDVPGEDPGVAQALSRKRAVQEKNRAFRNALLGASGGAVLASGGAK